MATPMGTLKEKEGQREAEAGLGKLVKFDRRQRSASDGAAGGSSDGTMPQGGARILIFTGVRYERHAPQPPAKRRSAARKKQTRG